MNGSDRIRWSVTGTICGLAMLGLSVAAVAEGPELAPINIGGVADAGGGSVKGVVKFDGEQKAAKPIRVDADPFCAQFYADGQLPTEERYVFGANDTLQNVIVYVSKGLEGKEVPKLDKPAIITQHGCVYVPHTLAVQADQPVEIHNEDNTMHNVNFKGEKNAGFNEAMVKGVVLKKQFGTPEMGAPFACNVHPWMGANLCVFDHPYFAVTQADGTFEIKGLPAGEYEVSTWHEFSKYFAPDQESYKVTVPDGGAGEVTITYAPKKRE